MVKSGENLPSLCFAGHWPAQEPEEPQEREGGCCSHFRSEGFGPWPLLALSGKLKLQSGKKQEGFASGWY